MHENNGILSKKYNNLNIFISSCVQTLKLRVIDKCYIRMQKRIDSSKKIVDNNRPVFICMHALFAICSQ